MSIILWRDASGQVIGMEKSQEEKPQVYGNSAWVDGFEVFSTDGKDVDLQAYVGWAGCTVEEFVRQHQRQPEIASENRLFYLVVLGVPVLIWIIALWLG